MALHIAIVVSFVHSSMAFIKVSMLLLLILLACFYPNALSLGSFHKLPLPPRAVGPEANAFDVLLRGPYTSVADGRIMKYEGPAVGFVEYASTSSTRPKPVCDGNVNPALGLKCGRPLGLAFYNLTRELYIADAYRGLVVVPANGGPAKQLAISADGVPFRLTDGLDVDQHSGVVYFTDASARYNISEINLAIATNDTTGRLLKYDIKTRNVTVLLSGLSGAAGCAVSADGSFVIVTEFISGRLQKYWLKGPKANTAEVLVTFRGRPDNIKRTAVGDFWVAVNFRTLNPLAYIPSAVRMDRFGRILANVSLSEQYGRLLISEVQEFGGKYYIGSMSNYVGVYEHL